MRALSGRLLVVALSALPLTGISAERAAAQGVVLQVGRLFDDGGWTAYHLAWSRALSGPLGVQMGGRLLRGPGSADRLLGAGLDATLFRGGRQGVYFIGGVAGGFGTGTAESWWRSWSAGIGYELLPLPFLSVGFEGRFHEMYPSRRAGAELAVRLGTRFGSAPAIRLAGLDSSAPATAAAPRRDVAPGASGADVMLRDVVRVAEGEIGRRYRLGGRGDPGDGFDCSGLIQYAYARFGVTLPRRSADQARAGRAVDQRVDALRDGDILTFSSGGGRVTHVGLYMGDGRFIHSASSGVQISRLSIEDPNGRWWHRRWVGVRRVVEPETH